MINRYVCTLLFTFILIASSSAQNTVSMLEEESFVDIIPDNTYEEIEERISHITNKVPLHFNLKIKSFIDYFSIKNRSYTREVLKKRGYFFPIFSKILKENNLPDELKYLAIVESGLKPQIISRAGAVGLWQFMPSTGKVFGLTNNWYIDERMDPHKATKAACKFLTQLYNTFGDWELALAAYNCGAGNVRKAIRRSGYKKTFWEIYRYLPRETRSYVPQFVAITYLLNHLEYHNLALNSEEFFPEMDTLHITGYFHLQTFADKINVCVDDLLWMNPEIKRGALPEYVKNYPLKIPAFVKDTVTKYRREIYDVASKVGKKDLEYLARNVPGSLYGRTKIAYRVRSGDVLGNIARKNNVRVSDLRAWNKLGRSNLIRVGQKLNIWVLPNYNSSTEKSYVTNKQTNSQLLASGNYRKKTTYSSSNRNSQAYEVKPGDSLWSISRATNTTISELKKANSLTSNDINSGQTLLIP